MFPSSLYFSHQNLKMKQVWKNISLPNNHNPSTSTTATAASSSPTSSLCSILLQDFLSRPSSSRPSPPPPPATLLSLNSGGPYLDFPADDDHQDEEQHSPTGYRVTGGEHGDLHHGPFDAFASSFMSSFGKKRLAEKENGVALADRRHKRMMMNRESAARSRARKQAYINELELENARLMAENAELKLKNHQQMLLQDEPVAHQIPHKKHPLQRTSTAPF